MSSVYDVSILYHQGARQNESHHPRPVRSHRTLQCREIEQPALGEREVLVRVRAAGLHVGDLFAVRGSPFLVRLSTGLRRPRHGVPGFDVAGTSPRCEQRSPDCDPATMCSAAALARAPSYASEGGAHRRQALDDRRSRTQPPFQRPRSPRSTACAPAGSAGQRVLINGASGGVGAFAVQIGKALGRPRHRRVLTRQRRPGALARRRRGIDYTREDFTDGARPVRPHRRQRRAPGAVGYSTGAHSAGTLVLNSGTGASGLRLFSRLVRPIVRSPFISRRLRRYISNPKRADLEWLAKRAADGSLRPVIGSCHPLAETAAALRAVARKDSNLRSPDPEDSQRFRRSSVRFERGADSDSVDPAGNQVEHAGRSQVNVIRSGNSGIDRIALDDGWEGERFLLFPLLLMIRHSKASTPAPDHAERQPFERHIRLRTRHGPMRQ